jgi:caa(3)-type oxidase subunit IV
MTTTQAEAAALAPEGHEEHSGHGDLLYVQIALILALITAVEVLTYFVDFGSWATPSLLIMMVVKAIMVGMFFMHLKDDSRLFSAVFMVGVVLAVLVYGATLTAFEFFA